jgi:N-methylhydantoinase B
MPRPHEPVAGQPLTMAAVASALESQSPPSGDAILLSIVQGTLSAIQGEMTATLRQSGRSNVATIARDYSHAIFDENAMMILQGEDLPAHLGSLMFGVKAVARHFEGQVRPGDVYYHNDPSQGGSHLPDMCAYMPIFIDGELTFWAVSKLHVIDAGGPVPGSYNKDAKDIFAEGLRIPPVRLVAAGELCDDVLSLILANIRSPSAQSGDIRAQLGAVRIANRRLKELCMKYGREAIRSCGRELLRGADRQMRALLASVPAGTSHGSAIIEDTGHGLGDIEIRAEASFSDGELSIWLESPPQIPFYTNSYEANTVSGVYLGVIMWAQLPPPYNEGLYSSISVDCGPLGTMLNAKLPAAHVQSTSVPNENVAEAVLQALTAASPRRRVGAWGRSYGLKLSGPDPKHQDGQGFVYNFIAAMISGAGAIEGVMDGWPTAGPANCLGGLTCGDTEVIESTYPLVIHGYEIRPDSGGAGEWRGGCGNRVTLESLTTIDVVTVGQGMKEPATGADGARNALPELKVSGSLITRADGTEEPITTNSRFQIRPGDRYRSENPGGGGCGDAFMRPVERVLTDVVNGFVSSHAAAVEYGVAVLRDADGRWTINADQTDQLRRASRNTDSAAQPLSKRTN